MNSTVVAYITEIMIIVVNDTDTNFVTAPMMSFEGTESFRYRTRLR